MKLPVWARVPCERLSLLFFPTPEAAEWFSIRTGSWWWLLLTPSLHLFAANPLFAGLAHVAGEGTWHTGMGVLLLLQTLALLWGTRLQRSVLLFAAGTLWAFIAALTGESALRAYGWLPLTTGVGVYAALSADCFWAGIRMVQTLYWDWLTRPGRTIDPGREAPHAPEHDREAPHAPGS